MDDLSLSDKWQMFAHCLPKPQDSSMEAYALVYPTVPEVDGRGRTNWRMSRATPAIMVAIKPEWAVGILLLRLIQPCIPCGSNRLPITCLNPLAYTCFLTGNCCPPSPPPPTPPTPPPTPPPGAGPLTSPQHLPTVPQTPLLPQHHLYISIDVVEPCPLV